MGIITHTLVNEPCNFPSKNSRYAIEDNIGERLAIHVHFGCDHQERDSWKVRLHFTYEQFRRVVKAMREAGKV